MKRFAILVIAVTTALLAANAAPKKKVACVGNSITYGFLVDNREQNSYPSRLAGLLDSTRYEVRNFGKSRSTLLRKGHFPYVDQPEFKDAIDYAPDIVLIHLGVNDTDPRNWPNYSDEFVTDYFYLIDSFKAVNPKVRIILANLTPIGAQHPRFKSGTRIWRDKVRESIANVAEIASLELIDFEDDLIDRPNLLPDGIHPNVEGAFILARNAYGAITGDWGGLRMSPLYSDSMVIQRNRPIVVRGRANAGSNIKVSFDGETASATADNRGNWSVTLAPRPAATGLAMTVTDGSRKLRFKDVAVGEVWLASGQSNMWFTLREETGGKDRIENADDSLFRFFNMRCRYLCDKNQWDSTALENVNRLEYFLPTSWTTSRPETAAQMSAVSYEFGRMLRDSLPGIPVGIIHNAVGGATTESYIDMQTLYHGLPEITVNWRKNDYVQPWVQERAEENAPSTSNPRQRHPYEPGYLYAAAIRQMEHFPIKGVVWYQGESNAHNIEVHETLFPLLVESWRKGFDNPQLPFYFVQLSSIKRPSWTEFRNSQRKLAASIDDVEMVVSFDHGDPYDVHPRNKRPIGERLARIALARQYGRNNMEYSGPKPERLIARDSTVTLLLSHADTLYTSDGKDVQGFELAHFDGLYTPATAKIDKSRVILSAPGVKQPRFVRYGWHPYSTANLTNEAKLPMSTFKMEIPMITDHTSQITAIPGTPTSEKGIEKGISAAYGSYVDNGKTLVIAGGCNFPAANPISPKARKRFYKGVYIFTPEASRYGWQHAGNLPRATAYGVTLQHNDTIILIGGTDEHGTHADIISVTLPASTTKADINRIGTFPVAIDNAMAVSSPSKGYIVGGNVDGKPSNRVFTFSFDNRRVEELPPMPGNPRVQPTVAISGNKLYVWGGFAPRHDGKEPTLETGGVAYDINSGKWEELAPVTDADGIEVSLGGGCAVTLPNGKILATGGVNKDIFINALRSQPDDYLSHPIEWYGFNGRLMIYDPKLDTWETAGNDPRCARAGALFINGAAGEGYLVGGELKPRVRTPQIVRVSIID